MTNEQKREKFRATIADVISRAEKILDQAESEGRSLTDAEAEQVEGFEARAKVARNELEKITPQRRTVGSGIIGAHDNGTIERKRPSASGISLRTADGAIIEARSHGEPVFSHYAETRDLPSIGDAVCSILGIGEKRDQMVGGIAGDGGFIVSPSVGAPFLDLARAESRLIEAGAVTVPMQSSEHVFAVLESDPVAKWRGEGKAINQSKGVLGQVKLRARSLSVLVKLSRELIQDADNAEAVITSSLIGAMAEELDRAMIAGDGKAGAPIGLLNTPGLSTHDAGGGPTGFNYDDIIDAIAIVENQNARARAMIYSPNAWKTLAKTRTSDGDYLSPPQAFDSLQRLSTTAVGDANVLLGDFSSCLLGIREGVTIRAGEMGDDGEKGLVSVAAHARGDFAVARPERVCNITNLGL